MRKSTLALAAALALPGTAFAAGAGTTAAPFLKIGMGARAVALGGAYGALGQDASSIFWNPAGLAGLPAKELSLGFTKYFQDIDVGHLAYAAPSGASRLGVGAVYLRVPDIERRSTADSAGIVPATGSFDAKDLAVSIAYAVRDGLSQLADGLDAGVALKAVRSQIDDQSGTAFAVDAGALYRASEALRFSLAARNIGTKLTLKSEGDPLPAVVSFGAAWRARPRLELAAGLDQYVVDEKTYAALGAEYWFRGALALRAGYRFGRDTEHLGGVAGLSLGVGLQVAGIGLDYAFLPMGELGETHRFGFWIRF